MPPFVEGKGLVAPSPVEITLTRLEIHELSELGRNQDVRNGYARSQDTWKNGYRSNATAVGLGGELALVRIVGSLVPSAKPELDVRPYQYGDGDKDMDMLGLTIQVKTRASKRQCSQRINYIRATTRSGRQLEHKSKRYVFCEWNYPSPVVLILGVVSRDSLGKFDVAKSAVDTHKNIVIPDYELEPVSRLITDIRSIRKWSNAN